MHNRRRRLSVAALAAFILAVTSSALAAQENVSTVGPPQLKDFSLPGQRSTPPAQQPPVKQPAPQATTTAPERPAPGSVTPAATPAATATTRRDRPSPARAAPVAAPASRPAEAAQSPATAPPAATSVPAATPAPVSPSLSSPAIPPAASAPAAATPALGAPINWFWIGAAALLALLGFFGFRRFSAYRDESRRRARREERAAVRAAEAAAAVPEPAAVESGSRARLELSFTAERAVATADETVVHYEMVLRNLGEEIARNIRIDVRMFNAGAKAAVASFLKGAIHDQSGSPHVTIDPGAELKLTSSIAMPKDEVKGIEVQGRSIFVPIVAINTAYDWNEGESVGSGRTSRSWLVGREPQAPSDKMGAFRLDLGPRIYRSVGQRPTELANVA